MIIRKDGIAAYEDYKGQLSARRWANAPAEAEYNLARTRLHQDVFRPIIDTNWSLKGKSFFTMGSCFAREVEFALSEFGQRVLSKVVPGSSIAFRKGGYTNRYNTAAMVNELEFALGLREFNSASIVYADKERGLFQDLHSHPAGGFCSLDVALERREAINSLFSRVREADVFVCTLGLTEVWYDKETGEYLNVSPSRSAVEEYYPDRFEFRVLDHADNMKNLSRIYEIVRQHLNPDMKIIVTVSPVPLLATFSGRDVVQANSFSKSTLRSCAESWVYANPGEIEYFPSFEMAMNSNRDIVWQEDLIHVTAPFVREIMRSFLLNFDCVDDPSQLRRKKFEESELMLMKVDSYHARGDLDASEQLLDQMEREGRKRREVEIRKLRLYCDRGNAENVRACFELLKPVLRPGLIDRIVRILIPFVSRSEDAELAADVICWLHEKNIQSWHLIRNALNLIIRNYAASKRILPIIQSDFPDMEMRIKQLEARVAAGVDAMSPSPCL